jgi:hypothetical protein
VKDNFRATALYMVSRSKRRLHLGFGEEEPCIQSRVLRTDWGLCMGADSLNLTCMADMPYGSIWSWCQHKWLSLAMPLLREQIQPRQSDIFDQRRVSKERNSNKLNMTNNIFRCPFGKRHFYLPFLVLDCLIAS